MIFNVLNNLIQGGNVYFDLTAVDEDAIIPDYRWNMLALPIDPVPDKPAFIALVKSIVAAVYQSTDPGPILDQMGYQYSRPDDEHTLTIDRPDDYPTLGAVTT